MSSPPKLSVYYRPAYPIDVYVRHRWQQGLQIGRGTFGLHDITEGRLEIITREALNKKVWMGGKDVWLVTSDSKCVMSLLNIKSGETWLLPSFSTISIIEVSEYYDLDFLCNHCTRTLRRVVLCRTPSNTCGYLAIALFSDGLLAYTANDDNDWKLFNLPTEYEVATDNVLWSTWMLFCTRRK